MATGWTTTGSLADSLPTVIDAARLVREFEGRMVTLVDRTNLAEGTGTAWNEVSLDQLTAAAVTELTSNENFQQLSDNLFSISPTFVQIVTLITDRTKARISGNIAALIGQLAQNAMQRKKDEDLLTVMQSATTDLGTAGAAMASGQVAAAVSRIFGNSTEPAVSAVYTVLHNFGIKDIHAEVAVVGTYPIPAGLTDEAFRRGFAGTISGSEVFHDGNITIDGADDAEGGTFAREAIVHVDGIGPRSEFERMPRKGGGSDVVTLTDEYGNGERSSGNWLFSHTHDATAPTS